MRDLGSLVVEIIQIFLGFTVLPLGWHINGSSSFWVALEKGLVDVLLVKFVLVVEVLLVLLRLQEN